MTEPAPAGRPETATRETTRVPQRTRRLFIAVACLTFAVYLVSARGLPTTFDEQIVFDTTGALVHAKPTIDTPLLRAFPGLSVRRSDGRRAGIYGIGTSVVGVPFYLVGKAVAQVSPASKRPQVVLTATMFTDALITAATVLVLMLLCFLLGAAPPGAVLVGLSYGLGSYAYPHAITLFTEPGTALCVLAAAFFAIRAARGARRVDLVLCGVWAGAALLFRISAALFLPIFGLWLLIAAALARDGRRVDARRIVEFGGWFTAGAFGPLLLLALANWWRYGSPTNLGYALGSARQSYPILRGLAGQWISSGKSLFIFAPVAVVVVLGLGITLRKLPIEMCLLGALVLANTLFFARVQFWSGDWAWGPRYMQIVLPCLAAMAAPLMNRRVWRQALVCLSIFGLVFVALPAVLVRFRLIFAAAAHTMPPASISGPPNWDHSYYALIWHTLHWQQVLYQLRLLPHAVANSLNHVTNRFGPTPVTRPPGLPRIEFWWLRSRDIGWPAAIFFALWPVAAAVAGVRMLKGALSSPASVPVEP